METPDSLRYTKTHEWVRQEEDGTFSVGITDFAQSELGEVVYAELPTPGKSFKTGDSAGFLESVKAVSDIYAPCDGEVVQSNNLLDSQPDLINNSPYERGFLYRMLPAEGASMEHLLDAAGYLAELGEN